MQNIKVSGGHSDSTFIHLRINLIMNAQRTKKIFLVLLFLLDKTRPRNVAVSCDARVDYGWMSITTDYSPLE